MATSAADKRACAATNPVLPSEALSVTTKPQRPDRRVKVAITLLIEDGASRRYYFHGRTKREARQKAEEARQRVSAGAGARCGALDE